MDFAALSSDTTVFCLPGLGTDARVFEPLFAYLPAVSFEVLPYIAPISGESPEAYAKRWAAPIGRHLAAGKKAALLGFSLGGMLAVHATKHYEVEQLILISTIKESAERPLLFKAAMLLPLHRIVPGWLSKWLVRPFSRAIPDKAHRARYVKMFLSTPNRTLTWSRHAAVSWQQPHKPTLPILHIHGTKDHIFPCKRSKPTHTIAGGTHYMIVEEAEAVAKVLRRTVFRSICAIS